jgi:hypothetical protein
LGELQIPVWVWTTEVIVRVEVDVVVIVDVRVVTIVEVETWIVVCCGPRVPDKVVVIVKVVGIVEV